MPHLHKSKSLPSPDGNVQSHANSWTWEHKPPCLPPIKTLSTPGIQSFTLNLDDLSANNLDELFAPIFTPGSSAWKKQADLGQYIEAGCSCQMNVPESLEILLCFHYPTIFNVSLSACYIQTVLRYYNIFIVQLSLRYCCRPVISTPKSALSKFHKVINHNKQSERQKPPDKDTFKTTQHLFQTSLQARP
jgi:hypothetical protein